MSFPILFKKGRIGTLKLKNRIVMPPMVRNYAEPTGAVTKKFVEHIKRIAEGGTGMLILEASFVSPEGKGFMNELGVHSDAMIPGLRRIAQAAHKEHAAIGVQIYHAGRQTYKKITKKQPVSPSAIPCPVMQEMPKVLTVKEIRRIVKAYGDAARRSKAAGMDFVEIHGAHGYLITQFLSPYSNKRTDAYGGSSKKRMRFMKEVYAAVRKAVGEDYPIVVRLSGDEFVPGGLRLADTVKIAKRLEELGADALHISAGNYGSYAQGTIIPPMAIKDAPLAHLARGVKRAVKIPVIAVAKLGDPKIAANVIRSKSADFVGIGRGLLADPEWPKKVKAGKIKEINRCIACNQGCISRLFAQQDVQCTVNPACGREALFARKPAKKMNIAVIGGGPAGMSAARTAAARGHRVTLYEKSKHLGGQLWVAGAAPHREGWNELRDKMIRDMKRLKVKVKLNARVTPTLLKGKKFDLAVIAIGSSAIRPNIPGEERTCVCTSRDALAKPRLIRGNVAVIGGGCAGAQTAEFAAKRKHKVTIVEMTNDIALDAPIDDRFLLLGRLKDLGVRMLTNTRALHIGSGAVDVQSKNEGRFSINADTVILCLGSRPNNGLAEEIKTVVPKVVVVGDAKESRKVTEAMAEGAMAVL
jgi:2,4-dienoyl-CoA reductase-like NADH-dependent reductase (Old Yellow Enzyme family)/thioredoxin reductase